MRHVGAILLLIYIWTACLLGLLIWGFWQLRRPGTIETLTNKPDSLLWWLSILAIFSLVVFLTYISLFIYL